jgi:hypothetical protein
MDQASGACKSCENVADNFVGFLRWTGSYVVILGFFLMLVSVAECVVVKYEKVNKNTLIAQAVTDVGFLGALIWTAIRKRNIAGSIADLCKDDDKDAMEYAPTTMGNLCLYHWMLEWVVSFFVVLILISIANFFWSCFGVAVGLPADFQEFTEKEDPPTFGASASDARANIAPMELGAPQGGSPFADDAAASDIHVEVK